MAFVLFLSVLTSTKRGKTTLQFHPHIEIQWKLSLKCEGEIKIFKSSESQHKNALWKCSRLEESIYRGYWEMSIRGKEKEQSHTKILCDPNMVWVSIRAACLVLLVLQTFPLEAVAFWVGKSLWDHISFGRSWGSRSSEAHFILYLNVQCGTHQTANILLVEGHTDHKDRLTWSPDSQSRAHSLSNAPSLKWTIP